MSPDELEPGRFQVEARAGDLRRYLTTLPKEVS